MLIAKNCTIVSCGIGLVICWYRHFFESISWSPANSNVTITGLSYVSEEWNDKYMDILLASVFL